MHRSLTSQNSTLSQLLTSLDELSDSELLRQVNELKDQIKMLAIENEIFEKTIMRLDPALMSGVQQALEYAAKISASSLYGRGESFVKSQSSKLAMDFSSPSRMLASPSRMSARRAESSARIGGTVVFGQPQKINVLEKSELVSTEMETLVNMLQKARTKAAKQHALLKAQLEEISVRVADVEKATVMFNREVIEEGWDKIAQRIPAEVWIRFMSEWVKLADKQIGKLRLRTSTLNTQYVKFKGQIKIKAELSESLRPVDFEKLKIENGQCVGIIEQKYHQLIELKKLTGDANLTLTVHKKALMDQNNYLSKIVNTIKQRETQTVLLDKETVIIQNQVDGLEQKLEDVRKVRQAYEVPDIMNYVAVKAEYHDLKHTIKMLENRVHVQQIALTSLNKKLQALLMESVIN